MIIREARTEDLERILEIYEIAKAFMRQTGNPHQWNSRYPDSKTSTLCNGRRFYYT